MCYLWQHEMYLWYLPVTACLYSEPSPVDLACLRNHLLHACRYWCCLLSPTRFCHAERQHSIFVLEYTSNPVWFLWKSLWNKKRELRDRVFHRNSPLQAAWDTSISHEAKQGCGVFFCPTFGFWGACWSKVLVHKDIICMYVMIVTFDFSLKHLFFCRYLVVGGR